MANGTTAKTPRKRKSAGRRNGQPREPKQVPFISAYDLSRDLCGSIDSGISDLASNKKHLKGFGR